MNSTGIAVNTFFLLNNLLCSLDSIRFSSWKAHPTSLLAFFIFPLVPVLAASIYDSQKPTPGSAGDPVGLVSQWYPTLCDAMDCSPPGSSVRELSQARILEWVAISSPGDLPDTGIEPRSPALQVDSVPLNHQGSSREAGGYPVGQKSKMNPPKKNLAKCVTFCWGASLTIQL